MSEENEQKKRNRFPDRFTVDPSNLEKLGRLVDQLESARRGCKITRKEMLNWVLEKFPNDLEAVDLKELGSRFYDEERFLRLALAEVRAAKANGNTGALDDFLKKSEVGALPKVRRKRKPKETDSTASASEPVSQN